MSIDISRDGAPDISGEGTCVYDGAIDAFPDSVDIVLTGNFTDELDAWGTIWFTAEGIEETTTWSGGWTDGTLWGYFEDEFDTGSFLTDGSYEGNFLVTREE
jgi:hypothetical protein